MVRQDPNLQKKAKPGEIAIRGDLTPDEVKKGDPVAQAKPKLGRLPDPGTAGIFRDGTKD
jgi:hypothetical protein